MTPRASRARLEQLAAGLSDRDRAILSDLGRLRVLTSVQVERLHFREGSPLTQARRARRTLERLSGLGVVHRLERRIGGVRAGSAGFVYGLGSPGQQLVTEQGPAGGTRLRRPWETSPDFLGHVLAVSELYVGLREAEREGGLELLAFDAEPACWRPFVGLGGERVVLKPDAYVRVGVGEYEEHGFVEVDLDTESSSVIHRKGEAYVRYWRSGVEQERRGVFPRVLFLVPDDQRAERVAGALGRLPPEGWQLFRVGRLDRATGALTGADTEGRPSDDQPSDKEGDR